MLYKYQRINSFLFQLLIDNSLWFSKPCDFNDPFDVQFQLNLKSTKEQRDEAVKTLVNQMKSTNMYFNETLVYDTLSKRAEEIDLDTIMNKNIYEEFQRFGISCFSDIQDNILLWSHYSDGHKGLCLEFDFSQDEHIDGWLWKVHYSNDYPIIINNDDAIKGLITKSTHWEYEREYRVVKPLHGSSKFSKSSLKSIIFGARIDSLDMNRIMTLVRGLGYEETKFKKASIATTKYELTFSDIE
jgi:hypothetical protein